MSSGLQSAIHGLSAAYLDDTDASAHFTTALCGLKQECDVPTPVGVPTILGTSVILLQYMVINRDYYSDWNSLVQKLPPLIRWAVQYPGTLEYRVRLASHYVLANTVISEPRSFPTSLFLSKAEQAVTHIDGLVGLSPQLLHLIQEITLATNLDIAQTIHSQLDRLVQTCPDPCLDEAAKTVVLLTAESYRLAAIQFLFYKFSSNHDCCFKSQRSQLLALLSDLPTTGRLYTAIHPLWAVFFACALSPENSSAKRLVAKLRYTKKSNIGPVVEAIERLWEIDARSWDKLPSVIRSNISLT